MDTLTAAVEKIKVGKRVKTFLNNFVKCVSNQGCKLERFFSSSSSSSSL